MYLESIEDNNMIYSVDMIRLKTYITYSEFSNLEFLINTDYKSKVKKLWLSDRVMCFKYNYVIELEEGKSFYFGFHCNNEKLQFFKSDVKYNLTLEFNPNKIKDAPLLLHILHMSGDWYLRSLDLAVDLKINILDLILSKTGKRTLKSISNGYDDKTYYIGTGDRRVKIYNKKKESNLKNVNELTRVEVSIQFEDFRLIDIKLFKLPEDLFPEIYTNDYIYSLSDFKDKTTFALLYAVQTGFPIDDLSRRYKEKIQSLLRGGHRVRFSRKTADEVIRRTVFHYLMPNELVRWH